MVLPVPGGPHRMSDVSSLLSSARRSHRPGPSRCSCPTYSARLLRPHPFRQRLPPPVLARRALRRDPRTTLWTRESAEGGGERRAGRGRGRRACGRPWLVVCPVPPCSPPPRRPLLVDVAALARDARAHMRRTVATFVLAALLGLPGHGLGHSRARPIDGGTPVAAPPSPAAAQGTRGAPGVAQGAPRRNPGEPRPGAHQDVRGGHGSRDRQAALRQERAHGTQRGVEREDRHRGRRPGAARPRVSLEDHRAGRRAARGWQGDHRRRAARRSLRQDLRRSDAGDRRT